MAVTTVAQEGLVKPVEITGVVKSETGAPLAGVQILTYAPYEGTISLGTAKLAASTKRYEVTTDTNGRFKIPSHGQLIFFSRTDLRPLTKIVDLSLTQLDVTMEDVAKSLWNVPPCSASDKANRVGIGFMVTVPKDVMVKKDNKNFDEGAYLFGFQTKDRVEILINWWDPTSLEPSDEYLLDSKDFSQRKWTSGDKSGHEFRGIRSDGRVWRRVSLKNGVITYQGNSPEAAKVFDSMIDGMCFDASAVKW